jgi:hypothetical protein
MKTSMSILTKAIIILLMLVVVLNILSLFVINNLNLNIVNSELYDYGLVFSLGWAGEYWSYLNLLFISISTCIALAVLSALSLFFLGKTQSNGPRAFSSFTLALGAVVNFLSLIVFFLIDNIVNSNLYNYSLQFNLNWYGPYFVQGNYFFAMQMLSVTLGLASIVLVFLTRSVPVRINSQKIIALFLIILGAILVGFSMFYGPPAKDLSTSSLVGLGLIFWGMIVGYISSEDYIKREVLEATNLSYVTTLNEMLDKLNFKEKAVFLPAKYLKDVKTNKVYISKTQSTEPFNMEDFLQETVNDKELRERLMIAPGSELVRLFEKTLGKSFAREDFSFFKTNMPKLLVNELEIAQNVDIECEGNTVKVKMKNLMSSDFSREIKDNGKAVYSVGTPLSSAIACALADSTGKVTAIKNYEISPDENTVEIVYSLIKEKGS